MKTRIAAAAAALALGASVFASGPTHADPIILPNPIPEVLDVDQTFSCLSLIPHALSQQNDPVTLDVRVLLDGGASQAVAERAVEVSQEAYNRLGITINASYEAVNFTTRDAAEVNAAAKAHYGGQTPPGIDVVYTLTTKDLNSGVNGDNVAGQADCIGGVRFDNRAFATGEIFPDESQGGTIPLPIVDGTGLTMAHEIGHLMGGHHHYFSIEGLFASRPNVATLMGPTLSIISLKFSTLNALMVRGHAQAYAD